ncbi:winged helix-turn-helix domain-containing protein [Saliphagus sp. LR7]|uniref:transcriptional regulator FilR1 domain-containing protein n=1 Tax=Saliphagus sp. LR7 TaxID=2282654 RepID=UPI001E3784BF|nr:winged helix-turn-helix domain-containing protein [Saliphagus sp. LR7]
MEHGLTKEDIVIRSEIAECVESSRLSTLRTLSDKGGWQTVSAIACDASVSRQTVSTHLEVFVEFGLVNFDANTREYMITASGVVALDSFISCLDVILPDRLAFLTRSEYALWILRELSETPAVASVFSTKADTPSQSTVWRIMTKLSEFGMVTETSEDYQLTEYGSNALAAYEKLEKIVGVCFAKAAVLQRLDLEFVRGDHPLPIAALEDTTVVSSGSLTPGLVTTEALELADLKTDSFACVISIYNPRLFKLYYEAVKHGMNGEGILSPEIYDKFCANPDLHAMLDNSSCDGYGLSRLERPITLGMGLYDSRKIALGAFNQRGNGQHTAMLLSTNQDLVEWGHRVYDSLLEEAIMTKKPA